MFYWVSNLSIPADILHLGKRCTVFFIFMTAQECLVDFFSFSARQLTSLWYIGIVPAFLCCLHMALSRRKARTQTKKKNTKIDICAVATLLPVIVILHIRAGRSFSVLIYVQRYRKSSAAALLLRYAVILQRRGCVNRRFPSFILRPLPLDRCSTATSKILSRTPLLFHFVDWATRTLIICG